MLPDETRPFGVTLRVHDIDPVGTFYQDELGLDIARKEPGALVLTPPSGSMQLRLEHAPEAPRREPACEGLFHIAFLVPQRRDLARILRRFQARGTRLQGAADHAVSEALYLQDPEGNGLEIYCDRTREHWPQERGEITMVTDPLDVGDLLRLADEDRPLPEGTRLGHVHLETTRLQAATRFYEGLGFRVTQSTFPGASFLAAGDYHHHVGINEWAVTNPRDEQATGLVDVAWRLPQGSIGTFSDALAKHGIPARAVDGEVHAEDPMGIGHRFREAPTLGEDREPS